MEAELFREEQRFRHWWIWLLIAPPAVLPWIAFVVQIILHRQFGDHPGPDWMIWLMLGLFGIGLPLLFARIRMTVVVTTDDLRIRYFPFYAGRIPLSDLASATVTKYSWGDFGGFGIHWSPGRGICYTMGGNQGVQVVLANGRQRLIGSLKSAELIAAITVVRRDLRPRP